LLGKVDEWNQETMDALAGRVNVTGPGVMFVVSNDGFQTYAPRVRIDGGERQRVPFGTSFRELTPGWHELRVENGTRQPWPHMGVEIAVRVPSDGHVTLLVTFVFPSQLPTVTPARGSEGAFLLRASRPMGGAGDSP
jgi:hypothetical protein